MTSESPSRPPRRPRAVPSPSPSEPQSAVFDDILSLLGEQLGQQAQAAADPRVRHRKLKNIKIEYENDARESHDFAGQIGYSLASNWFTQLLAQLLVANGITKSQLCVFLYVAGGLQLGTGITAYTQQEITDGLNELAARKPGAKRITRPTVNRAVRALCEFGWLESAGHGRIRLNVTLWFRGSSGDQKKILAEIASGYPENADPATQFPNQIGPALVHHQQELDLDLNTVETETPQDKTRRTG
ncbi:hypothetical protein [Streptomyces sp. V1I6]|uniref:hypothetical protein n=1 Tax=Streptomyces sp. V1I6 TaxID=3042273 RepID=UPI00278A519B|nr:hypothetical protein [Streptomyces sp. V1I6]MDQ0847681.1 hypothetical protein [Streptomyces sp. V1I6]